MLRLSLLVIAFCLCCSTAFAQSSPPGQTAQTYAAEIQYAEGSDINNYPLPGTIKITIFGKTTGADPHAPESTYLRFLHYAPAGTEDWSEFAMNKTDQEAPAAHLNKSVQASLVANLPEVNWPFEITKAKSFRVRLTLKEYTLGQFNQVQWVTREVDLGTVTIRKTFTIYPLYIVLVSYDYEPTPPPPGPAP